MNKLNQNTLNIYQISVGFFQDGVQIRLNLRLIKIQKNLFKIGELKFKFSLKIIKFESI